MNPTPFYKYGLNLDIKAEQAIDALPLHELTDLLDNAATSLNIDHYIDNESVPVIEEEDKPIDTSLLSSMGRIGLIRGLCDRIELKLMEVAS
ncbi:hypothetical protein [Pseudanabaena sp. 'Roaring Creek']|uniref:hypothetical protein n=1 Tax=Pseudanabaena sp. 'Roaring Creek' TaxID=1681830 RepID=UPI0006D84F28|nr:hypothetical protein [Pseudanabaena sp. 'Roaring Creek']